MGHGRPDFFGTSIHPKYGTTKRGHALVACPALAYTTVLEITGKGVLLSGEIFTTDADCLPADHIRLKIDGNLTWDNGLDDMLEDGYIGSRFIPFSLTLFNPDLTRYSVYIGELIPFENSITMQYYPTGPNPVSVTCYLIYAIME